MTTNALPGPAPAGSPQAAPGSAGPLEDRDNVSTIGQHTTMAGLAGAVVWDLLVHDPWHGPDLARAAAMPLPDGADAEDMWQLVYDLVTGAAEFGYGIASMDLSRALAALSHRPTVEDGHPFPPVPDWRVAEPEPVR